MVSLSEYYVPVGKAQSLYSHLVLLYSMVMSFFKNIFSVIFEKMFANRKDLKVGLYGPPNGGKTTLANKICVDWVGEEMGAASNIPHETREVQIKEKVIIKNTKGKELQFNLVDTPGIATKIDFEEFLGHGMKEKEAKTRAKEATKGVIQSIKWLDDMDVVLIVLDSTVNPYNQVNVTIIGNLEARKIPVLIAANKVDLKKSDLKKIEEAFPQYSVIGISAKTGKHLDKLYNAVFDLV